MYGPQTDFHWRLALLAFWVLPIGLSVAYKLFTIGHVSAGVHHLDTVNFGFYLPVGLEKVGRGIALMADLSLPFIQGTTAPDNYNADPLYAARPGPYGMNTLLMSPTAAVALDFLNPKFVADKPLSVFRSSHAPYSVRRIRLVDMSHDDPFDRPELLRFRTRASKSAGCRSRAWRIVPCSSCSTDTRPRTLVVAS